MTLSNFKIESFKMKNYDFKDVIFLNIAKEIAKMSKCQSYKVGAIIVKDQRIISTGYNGTPSGFQNCSDLFKNQINSKTRKKHHEFSEKYEIHAEINAIIFAAKSGISIDGADMYLTLHPCNNCLKTLCNTGIKNIYYSDNYDKFEDDKLTQELLNVSKINLIKVD